MAVNKVVYGTSTIIDISDTTATADKVLQGYDFYDAGGVKQTGTATGGGIVQIYQDQDGYVVLDDEGSNVTTVTPLTVTENGTYGTLGGSVAYQPVTVSVAGGGSDCSTEIIERTISGSYYNASATTVGSWAFYACSNLTSVSFPVATSINGWAFASCINLTTVSIPSATSIGSYAFANCSSLNTVSFPVATYIGSYAFTACSSLTTVSIPSATSIGTNAFSKCFNLTNVSFPAATFIGSWAFASCSSLTTANFPVVTSIGPEAFVYCVNLASVNIPNATSIESYAFQYCSNLTSVSFPVVAFIGSYAFSRCIALESVYCLTSAVPTLYVGAFVSTPIALSSYLGHFGSIFVKESLLVSFKTASYWSAYSARMVGLTDAQISALGGS